MVQVCFLILNEHLVSIQRWKRPSHKGSLWQSQNLLGTQNQRHLSQSGSLLTLDHPFEAPSVSRDPEWDGALKCNTKCTYQCPPPRGGKGKDTLGIIQPKQSLPPRNLTDNFGTGAGPKMPWLQNLEIMSKFEGDFRRVHNCVTWVGN